MLTRIDHIVYIGSDLATTVAHFADLTGIEPNYGGTHVTGGTANYLAGMGEGRYIELLGPSREQEPYDVQGERDWGRICRGADAPEAYTFCVASDDLERLARRLASWGVSVWGPKRFSRKQKDESLLTWRLLYCNTPSFGVTFPFFIDWGDSAHPSGAAAVGCELDELVYYSPHASQVERIFKACEIPVEVRFAGISEIRVTLRSPNGTVFL